MEDLCGRTTEKTKKQQSISGDSESQVVLDFLCPSSQPGNYNSFIESTLLSPKNLPDSSKRDGKETRFDFLEPETIKETENDDANDNDTLVSVQAFKFNMQLQS